MNSKNRISLLNIIKFNMKLILKERSFVVMNAAFFALPLFFSAIFIFLRTGEQALVFLNFYLIFYVNIFGFILVLRILQFFIIYSRDNKLLYLTLTNEISRTSMLMSQMLICIVNIIVMSLWSSLSIFIASLIFSDYWQLILRVSLVFFLYVSLVGTTLATFILFLMLFATNQATTIIVTLVLSFSFISALPRQLVETNDSYTILKFQISPTEDRSKRITEVYDAFNLQKFIRAKQIKYPNLTYALNEFLVDENEYTLEKFTAQTEGNIYNRLSFWNELGLINNSPLKVEFGDESQYLTVMSAGNSSELTNNIVDGNKVRLELEFENSFISQTALDELIDDTTEADKKAILIEFRSLTQLLLDAQIDFQKNYSDFFDDYVILNEANSKITNIEDEAKSAKMTNALLKNLYHYNLTPQPNLQSSLTLQPDANTDKLVREQLYNPLMLVARVLEQNLINYTANYVVVTSNPVVEDQQWTNYLTRRNYYALYNYINLHNAIVTNYTYYVGISHRDLWFSTASESYINLKPERNIFMSYVDYKFQLDDEKIMKKDSYNSYLPPWIYIVISLGLITGFLSLAIFKFNRIDLK